MAKCEHTRQVPGGTIPLRYGSAQTRVCRDCGAWRMVTHHGEPDRRWPWRTDALNIAMIEPEMD